MNAPQDIANVEIPSPASGKKILCVEDNRTALAMLEMSLKELGYNPILANSAEEALKILKHQEDVSIVVSDWVMPDMDGLELCQHIRAQPNSQYIYFILLTANSGEEKCDEAINKGVDDFLTKPVNMADLKHRLRVSQRIIGFVNELIKLKSYLPVCMYCKKIQNEESVWEPFETYISHRIGTKFSHGICLDCYDSVLKEAKAGSV